MKTPLRFTRGAAALALLAAVASSPAVFAAPNIVAGDRIDVAVARHGARSEASFAAVRVGMPAAEVAERLGAPDRRIRFDRTRTTSWDYDFRDSWGYAAEFSVVLDDAGRVVETVTVRHDA